MFKRTHTEEFLDVVDENNELIGEKVSRKRVHSEGLWHRLVHVYVFRNNKEKKDVEFLVHLRSPYKDHSPNMWDTRFGGHIQSGESVEECLRAEAKEEIGLDTRKYPCIEGEWVKWDDFPNREMQKIYFLEFTGDDSEIVFNDGEVQEVRWMGADEIRQSIQNNPQKWSAGLEGFVKVSEYARNI